MYGFIGDYSVFVDFSGESMENALRACCKGIKIGKVLIHGEGNDGRQKVYCDLLTSDIDGRHIKAEEVSAKDSESTIRLKRYWLKGEKVGRSEIFANLPWKTVFDIVGWEKLLAIRCTSLLSGYMDKGCLIIFIHSWLSKCKACAHYYCNKPFYMNYTNFFLMPSKFGARLKLLLLYCGCFSTVAASPL
ncbi:hypothetical protein QQ045_010210 [Rhodiola kirilowii]